MRTLVTGATGHTGACLVRELLKEGHEVVALAMEPSPKSIAGLDVEYRRADIRDFEGMCYAMRDVEIVIHLAGLISITGDQGGKVFDININGARNVALAALKQGIKRLIHVSSIHSRDQEPFDQILCEKRQKVSSPLKPAYDRSKAAGEEAVMQFANAGLDVVCAIPTGVIGPYDYGTSLTGNNLLRVFRGKLHYYIEGGFNWVDVRDVAKSLVALMDKGEKGEAYILGGHWQSIQELFSLASQVSGRKNAMVQIPMPLARFSAPFMMRINQLFRKPVYFSPDMLEAIRCNRLISHEKAAKTLGHNPRPTDETLKDLYRWWKEQGAL